MRCVVLFSKAPVPGEVKTRLYTDMSPADAAIIQEAFIIDTLQALDGLSDVDVFIACHPSVEDQFFLDMKKDFNVDLVAQGNGDLGKRIKRVIEELRLRGYVDIAIVGSDSPTLPAEFIREALASLKDRDIVIGPSIDGGYYLIALSGDATALFDGINWGSDKVFDETMERVEREGYVCRILPFWYDVDTINELRYLAIHLGSLPDSKYANTREALSRTGVMAFADDASFMLHGRC